MLSIELRASVALSEPHADQGLVTWVDASILDEEVVIGSARLALIHVAAAMDVGEPIWEVLDADSAELEALYEVYFQDDWLKDEFAEGIGADVIYFASIDINDGHRDRGIELAIVRRLCDTIGDGYPLAVVPITDTDDVMPWLRMGFDVTRHATPETCGYLHLRLGYRTARVIEDDGRFRAVPNPDPRERWRQN